MLSLCALGACAEGPTQTTGIATPSAVRFAKSGNSANAKICQKGGYLTVLTATGAPFATAGECAGYGAAGGAYTPASTLVATWELHSSGAFGNVRIVGTGLKPLTIVFGHYWNNNVGDITMGAVVQPDGTASLLMGIVCGFEATNGYAEATTLSGGTIESNHISPIC